MRKLTSWMPALACAAWLASCTSTQVSPPEAVLPVPEPKQVDWQKMETYAFIHFGPNTFTGREWDGFDYKAP